MPEKFSISQTKLGRKHALKVLPAPATTSMPAGSTGNSNGSGPSSTRLLSLDALRGFDMIWIMGLGMALIAAGNWTGSKGLSEFLARQLEHGPWASPDYGRWAQGVAFWDLIMPLFLFCTGTSLPFSMAKRRQRGESTARIYGHIVSRVVVLWLLGMIEQGRLLAFDLSKLHLYCNTLQAIAAGYLVASVVYLHFRPRAQALITAGLLLLYWAVLTFVAALGAKSAVILPEQNIADWIDKALLGRFDDGVPYTWILSSMAFACSVMLGVFAGQWVRSPRPARIKVLGLLGGGASLTLAGFVWSGWSPINKYLWTSSMVLYWGGWSVVLLGIFYLFLDVLNWRKPAFPFLVVGSNAIAAYMIPHFVSFRGIATQLVGGLEHHLPACYPVILSSTRFLCLWLLLYWMYRTKTFLKV